MRLAVKWIDHALGRSARSRGLTLSHRCVAALEVVIDHVVINLKTNGVVGIVSLGPCRGGYMGRPDQNEQSQDAHHNFPAADDPTTIRLIVSPTA